MIRIHLGFLRPVKWADKSTTSYDMLEFKSYAKSLTRKYLVIGPHVLQIQGILLQLLMLNLPICQLQTFYLTLKM